MVRRGASEPDGTAGHHVGDPRFKKNPLTLILFKPTYWLSQVVQIQDSRHMLRGRAAKCCGFLCFDGEASECFCFSARLNV